MIDFLMSKDNKQVCVRVKTGLTDDADHKIHFWYNCEDEMFSELFQKHLTEKFHDLVKAVRREEYERGWKEAKGKKSKKQEWFSWVLKPIYNK